MIFTNYSEAPLHDLPMEYSRSSTIRSLGRVQIMGARGGLHLVRVVFSLHSIPVTMAFKSETQP